MEESEYNKQLGTIIVSSFMQRAISVRDERNLFPINETLTATKTPPIPGRNFDSDPRDFDS